MQARLLPGALHRPCVGRWANHRRRTKLLTLRQWRGRSRCAFLRNGQADFLLPVGTCIPRICTDFSSRGFCYKFFRGINSRQIFSAQCMCGWPAHPQGKSWHRHVTVDLVTVTVARPGYIPMANSLTITLTWSWIRDWIIIMSPQTTLVKAYPQSDQLSLPSVPDRYRHSRQSVSRFDLV